jgi:hypothetical protein
LLRELKSYVRIWIKELRNEGIAEQFWSPRYIFACVCRMLTFDCFVLTAKNGMWIIVGQPRGSTRQAMYV